MIVSLAAPLAAQQPAPTRLSFGIQTSHVSILEERGRGDVGRGTGARLGLPVGPAVALEVRYGQADIEHRQVPASYRLHEAHFGVRYIFRRGSDRIRPFVDALAAARVGEHDRAGITPGPDLTAIGAGIGIGSNFRILWGFWASAAVESEWNRLQHGRVENGDWLRLSDTPAGQTHTRRLTAGINWHF